MIRVVKDDHLARIRPIRKAILTGMINRPHRFFHHFKSSPVLRSIDKIVFSLVETIYHLETTDELGTPDGPELVLIHREPEFPSFRCSFQAKPVCPLS